MLVAIGVLLGIRIVEEFGRRNGVKPEVSTDFATHTLGVGFAGALLLNAVFYNQAWFGETADNIAGWFDGRFKLTAPGLSSYGGFFGAAAGIMLFRYRRGIPVMRLVDPAAFAFPFGWFFGRMGCFVVHDHPGRPSDFFLAVDNYQTHGGGELVARHDLGLYEVIWSFVVGLLFLYLAQKKRKGGTYLALLIMLYAPIRFCLDFLRATGAEGGDDRIYGLTAGQYSSIAFLLFGAFLLRKVLTEPEAELPERARYVPPEEETMLTPAVAGGASPSVKPAASTAAEKPSAKKGKKKK
jgi:phosphatidylglycerol:prolipoprotein diacylglycerol transferase